MTTSRTQRIALTSAAAIGLTLGAAGLAAAATSQTAPEPAPATQPAGSVDAPDHDDDVTYTSSITAPETATDSDLAALATITGDDAVAAAQNATGGTATQAELENEHGNVVYDVEVSLPDGTTVEVTVDAGNATVLAQEADDNDEVDDNESDDHESDDDVTYTSSITAPETATDSDLAALATITGDDAVAAAQNATGGTATQAELENEHGNVVYDVEVSLPDGTTVEVTVDAGNATVLAQEADDN